MSAIKLMPYTIRIHPKGEASEADRWNLTEFQQYIDSVQSQIGQSSDEVKISNSDTFMDLLRKFCKYYESNLEKLEDKDEQLANVTFALSPDWEPSKRIVEGNLYLGNFGVVRNIVDTQDGERQERGRDLNDSEERPLYFLTYLPSENAPEEGDIHLLTDMSIQAHNYLDIVVGYDTGTRSLFR